MSTPKRTPLILAPSCIHSTASEQFPDPQTGGSVTWKTLISSPQTHTDTFTVGIASCGPGASAGCRGHLAPHRHAQAEIYHVTQGKGVVAIEGREYAVEKGTVVWIPGDAEHGVVNTGAEELVWLYVFAADGFADVVYRFAEPGGQEGKPRAKL
ncbi:hypothetical protein SVAN01_07049 [Stagonosporopsis vannaccii]|nr:hypothetical protein SVAN01_07049 [Stagonosporopsis vannaccii]